MGDRVAVMRKGELQQVATPQELYDRPVNLFVGGFIGSPAMNMLEATARAANGDAGASCSATQRLALDAETLEARPALRLRRAARSSLGIRPEDLEDAALAHGRAARTAGCTARSSCARRSAPRSMVHLRDRRARRAQTDETPRAGARTSATSAPRSATPTDGEHRRSSGAVRPRSRVQEGDDVEVAVDTRALHFFDPETGLGIYDETDERRRA